MIVFNRCTEETRKALRARNLKMVNRRADIYLENMDGTSEDYADETISAFDLNAPVIEIGDDDYGVFYVEAMDLPKRFDGKTVRFKAQMCRSPQFADGSVPGRFAMVCCANDITFLGMACKGGGAEQFQNRDWVTITATVKAEHLPAYGEEPGPRALRPAHRARRAGQRGSYPVLNWKDAARCAPGKETMPMKPTYANFFGVSKVQNQEGELMELTLNISHKYMEQQSTIGPTGVETISTPAMEQIASIVLTPANARALRALLNKTLGEQEL